MNFSEADKVAESYQSISLFQISADILAHTKKEIHLSQGRARRRQLQV
jgi:hypothetical protein